MALENIRLSQQAKDQLAKIKRMTGIEHSNILCRWALCVSLAESSIPPQAKIPADSNLEMTWRVFGGQHADIYAALIIDRCFKDNLSTDADSVAQQFRLHLHRGISYLAGNKGLRKIDDLIALIA